MFLQNLDGPVEALEEASEPAGASSESAEKVVEEAVEAPKTLVGRPSSGGSASTAAEVAAEELALAGVLPHVAGVPVRVLARGDVLHKDVLGGGHREVAHREK